MTLLRHQIAAGWLWGIVVFPIVSTMERLHYGWAVEGKTALLMLLFCCLLLPETVRGMCVLSRNRLARLSALVTLVSMFVWHYFQGYSVFSTDFSSIRRFWMYVVAVPFFVALREWFRIVGVLGIQRIFLARTAVVFVALVAISYVMWMFPAYLRPLGVMPVYWHVRHLNYDLLFAIAFFVYLLSISKSPCANALCVTPLAVLGYFSAWSGGRGGLLATLLFFLILMVAGVLSPKGRVLWLCLASLLLGAVLCRFAGTDQLLWHQLDKLGADSVNKVSSGRIDIWTKSVELVFASPETALFGYGPDAVVRVGLPKWPGIAMAHNSIVQWLLEFGLIGTAVAVVGLARCMVMALAVVRADGEEPMRRIMGALFLATVAFSLTDGLLYHVAPLVMVIAICAFLSSAATSASR